MSAKYQTKKTSELVAGDVVNCHGMRCLIDGPIELSKSHDDSHNGTRYTRARVLNRSEVPFESVPASFTAPRGDETDERWTIQGNDLARWSVELPEPSISERLGVVTDAGEIKQRETAQLVAELAVLGEYDAARSRMGHDYGSGQRNSEFARRIRELRTRGVDAAVIDQPSDFTEPALFVAAFEKIGVARMRRAESETYRSNTPSTSRTLRAWRMVGMLAEQKRQEAEREIAEREIAVAEDASSTVAEMRELSARDADDAPRPTGFVLGTIVEHVDSGQTGTIVGRAISQRSAGGALMQRVKWDHGFKQSDEGAPTFVSRLREHVVEPPASTEEAIESAAKKPTTVGHGPVVAGVDRFSWLYDPIARDGGEKWRLVERRSYGDATVATLIRLPGTLTRVFASQYASDHYNVPSQSDHADPCEARLVLGDRIGFELPRVPNRSDADHARAAARFGRSSS